MAANTLLTCPDANVNCAAARNGTAVGAQNNNNSYVMQSVDVDADPTTTNSSTATLALPSGATVLFAGLYWGANEMATGRGTALLQVPGAGGYQTVTASQVDCSNAGACTPLNVNYQSFADVTSIVSRRAGATTRLPAWR